MKQPCDRNCKDRSSICHAVCEKWLAYEEARNKEYERARKERDINGFLGSMDRKRVEDIKAGRLTSKKNKKI